MKETNEQVLATSITSILNNAGFTKPIDLETEKSVISMMLRNMRALVYAIETLCYEAFYNINCRNFYKAIQKFYFDNNGAISLQDLHTHIINENLLSDEITYNTQLVSYEVFLSQVEKVKEDHIRREAIDGAICLLEDAFDTLTSTAEIELAAETLSRKFWLVSSKYHKDTVNYPLTDLLNETLEEIAWLQKHDQLRGTPSGYEKLDKVTSGWRNGDLILIAARPNIGLEALALNMARNAAVDHNIPIAYCTTSRSANEITVRLISAETGIPKDQLLNKGQLNKTDWQNIEHSIRPLCNAPLHIISLPSQSLDELHFTVKRLVEEHSIRAIYIDNIDSLYRETLHDDTNATITLRFLKNIAKQFNISVIVLQALDMKRAWISGTVPSTGTLREQGISDKCVDEIVFLHRDYYEDLVESPSDIGKTKIILAKNTHGELTDFYLRFDTDKLRFDNFNH